MRQFSSQFIIAFYYRHIACQEIVLGFSRAVFRIIVHTRPIPKRNSGLKFFFSPQGPALFVSRTKRSAERAMPRHISRMEVPRKKKREIARRSDGQGGVVVA